MFTGIVQLKGRILEMKQSEAGAVIRIETGALTAALEIGSSISVDGVCLTVVRREDHWVEVVATPETLRRSNLGGRALGHLLNLEPALRLSDFLGGHLVQGHVDGTGSVLSVREEGNSWVFRIAAPPSVLKYCVIKGSVTLNGISLTVSGIGTDWFEVTIIPHTMEVTNMAEMKVGEMVNLEADVISKYVESHVQRLWADGNPFLPAAPVEG